MISIRRLALAAVLAVVTLNLAPNLASAQEPARGKFTLTHDVLWSGAKLPAGDYKFSFNIEGVSPLLTLTKVSGAPSSFMVLVPMTEETKYSADSRLMLETTPDGSYVSALRLPQFGMTLHFNGPLHTTEKMAKAGLVASAGQ
jgi:hypothetical protein